METRTLKCWICGALYQFMNMMVGDQSVCGACRAEARNYPYQREQQAPRARERRRRAFPRTYTRDSPNEF